jgi:hypothetical protein
MKYTLMIQADSNSVEISLDLLPEKIIAWPHLTTGLPVVDYLPESKWKSIKDHTPEQNKPYLIYEVYPTEARFKLICAPLVDCKYKLAEWSNYYKGFVNRESNVYKYAAFFMELPQPPKIEEKP